jgi:beta-lactamase regulating signal transducer with metallopeptidase domain
MTMVWMLSWIGQSLALVALTSAFERVPGCRANASARSAAWTVALGLMVVLAVCPLLPSGPDALSAPPATDARPRSTVLLPVAIPEGAIRAITASWLATGAIIWGLGSLLWVSLAARDVRRVGRLKRAAHEMLPVESHRLARWPALISSGRSARLCWCDELDGPAVLGFADPVVALPRAQGAHLTDEELEHVVLHELAHVRRRDDWAALFESVLVGLMWVNPAAHWARRRLALSREMACDDWVVRRTAAPVAYARCLTAVASLRSQKGRVRLAAAATGRSSALTKRVTRVLESGARPGPRLSRAVALLTPLGVGVVGVALLQLPPLIVDGGPGRTTAAPLAASASRAADARADVGRVAVTEPTRPDRPRVATMTRRGAAASPVAVLSQLPEQPASGGELPPLSGEPDRSSSRENALQSPLLNAVALPGVGAPGVTVADGSVASGSSSSAQNTPWWGRAAALGAATGEGATTAGRATASFLKRLGTRVPQPFTR